MTSWAKAPGTRVLHWHLHGHPCYLHSCVVALMCSYMHSCACLQTIIPHRDHRPSNWGSHRCAHAQTCILDGKHTHPPSRTHTCIYTHTHTHRHTIRATHLHVPHRITRVCSLTYLHFAMGPITYMHANRSHTHTRTHITPPPQTHAWTTLQAQNSIQHPTICQGHSPERNHGSMHRQRQHTHTHTHTL